MALRLYKARMEIIQVYNVLIEGTGVSNIILNLSQTLTKLSISNKIFALQTNGVEQSNVEKYDSVEEMPFSEDSIIIYHLANGSRLNYQIERLPQKKILFYHNVSYPYFFRDWDDAAVASCERGLTDAKESYGNYLKAFVLSEFSRNQLVEFGWADNDVFVLPSLGILHAPECKKIKIKKDYSKFLFVGRLSPNKKIEDVIRVFSFYQKRFDNNASLTLIGSAQFEEYYKCLQLYVQKNKIENVTFTGHVSAAELERHYDEAGIFLCMSEHEGFCIPIIEAMAHDDLVVGYSASAVPGTMGGAGLLFETKDEERISEVIHGIISNPIQLKNIILAQRKRLESIDIEAQQLQIVSVISEINNSDKPNYRFENDELYKYIGEVKLNNQNDKDKRIVKLIGDNNHKVVIYGAGMAGKEVFRRISTLVDIDQIVFCDNGGDKDAVLTVPVIKHDKCISQYRDSLIIITVQKQLFDIYSQLLLEGISKDSILLYDFKAKSYIN